MTFRCLDTVRSPRRLRVAGVFSFGNGGAGEEERVIFLNNHSAALRTPGSSSGLCQATNKLRSCSSIGPLSTLSSIGSKLNKNP